MVSFRPGTGAWLLIRHPLSRTFLQIVPARMGQAGFFQTPAIYTNPGGSTASMVGSLGAANPLLVLAVPGILPEMSIEESLDVTRIYAVADQLLAGTPLIRNRPRVCRTRKRNPPSYLR